MDLEPGDVLAVPAGAWHGVCGDEDCTAFNLSFRPDSFTAVLGTLLSSSIGDSKGWRSGLPPILASDPERVGEHEVEKYLCERFDELEALGLSLAGDQAKPELWRAMIRYARSGG